MATWTTLPDASLEPGKPIRSIDGLALRDNPIAISEGAVGAPKIQTNGITDSAVTTAKLASNEQMTTANVLNATAAADAGAVGTYAFLKDVTNSSTSINQGTTVAGSALRFSSLRYDSSIPGWDASAGQTPSGTWRLMGFGSREFGQGSTLRYASLFLRIS
jgi:hypothetical protein